MDRPSQFFGIQRYSLVNQRPVVPIVSQNVQHSNQKPLNSNVSRQIPDKNDQNQQIQNILDYLTSSGYQLQLTRLIIKQPQTKTFHQMANFLIKKLSLNIQQEEIPLEDIPIYIKYLGYPYQFQKNIIQSIGAPHTTSHVLNLLSWLVNQLKYKEQLLNEQNSNNEELHQTQDILNNYVQQAFQEMDSMKILQQQQYVETKLKEKSEKQKESNRNDEIKLETTLLAQKNIMAGQPDLQELDNRITQIDQNIYREQQLTSNLENEQKQLLRQIDEKDKQIFQICMDIENQRQIKEENEQIIQNQTLNITEAQIIEQQMKSKVNSLQRLKDQLSQLVQQRDELYRNLEKLKENCERDVNEYNEVLQKMQVVTNNYTQQQTIIAKLNFENYNQNLVKSMLNNDKQSLINKLLNFDLKQAQNIIQQEVQKMKDQIQHEKIRTGEFQKDQNLFVEQLRRVDEDCKSQQRNLENLMNLNNQRKEELNNIIKKQYHNVENKKQELNYFFLQIENEQHKKNSIQHQHVLEQQEIEKFQEEGLEIQKLADEINQRSLNKFENHKKDTVFMLKNSLENQKKVQQQVVEILKQKEFV